MLKNLVNSVSELIEKKDSRIHKKENSCGELESLMLQFILKSTIDVSSSVSSSINTRIQCQTAMKRLWI